MTTADIRVLAPSDDRGAFRSGNAALDDFFHCHAGQNQFRHHIGVTYVADVQETILGVVTVASATLDADDLPSGRKMPPYPLPVLRIARLAVAERARGRGLGRSLLRFVFELAEHMRDEVGCVGLLVDAKAQAVAFYTKYGFFEVDVLKGQTSRVPRPVVMYLPLGAIPARAGAD